MKSEQLQTDSLGFTLNLTIRVGDFQQLGQHKCYEDESGAVQPDSPHQICVQAGQEMSSLIVVSAHEVYHLFKSIRPLVSCDEETEAEVFGELVGKIVSLGSL